MGVSFWIDSITLSSGQSLSLEKESIVVVVGANNAGKSSLLREVHAHTINERHAPGPVTRGLSFKQEGTSEEFEAWMEANMERRHVAGHPEPSFWGIGSMFLRSNAINAWRNGNGARALQNSGCFLADALSRLTAANPPPPINYVTDAIQHPIHLLYRDDSAETRLSANFRRAFGMDLLVHRAAGNSVPLLWTAPRPEPGEDRVSVGYLRRLGELTPLDRQGDGMRSFVGSLLSMVVPSRFVVMIDEPEAFLHPPQARLLGSMLAKDKPTERQLFIATHSGDVLRGLLDADPKSLRVVRVRRDGATNRVSQLDPEDVRKVWSDPILRFSNILDGVFHERVVICEGDADCRFYAAVAEANATLTDSRRPDIMFASSGGKHRLPTVLSALTRLDVPSQVIADFDILQDEQPLRGVFEALGGSWSHIEADWRGVKATLEARTPPLTSAQVREQIERILASVTAVSFPEKATEEIRSSLRAVSPWSLMKLTGVEGLPGGQPTETARRLLTALRAKGLFVVECGELERFAKSAAGHGPSWVANVLSRDLKTDPELEPARRFMNDVISS